MASIFSKIINGEIKGNIIFQDELCAVLQDIQPQAPHHFLIIPKKEIPSIAEAEIEDKVLLGHLLLVAGQVARDKGFSEQGYRLVTNIGKNGGQTVSHLHIHLLAGRSMSWPPG